MMTHILKKITHQAKDSFKTSSFKPIAMTMIVIAGLLFANTAFAARRVTALNVGTQNKTATYGTAVNTISYTISFTETGTGGSTANKITISWPACLPGGVTTSLDAAGATYTPNGNGQ